MFLGWHIALTHLLPRSPHPEHDDRLCVAHRSVLPLIARGAPAGAPSSLLFLPFPPFCFSSCCTASRFALVWRLRLLRLFFFFPRFFNSSASHAPSLIHHNEDAQVSSCPLSPSSLFCHPHPLLCRPARTPIFPDGVLPPSSCPPAQRTASPVTRVHRRSGIYLCVRVRALGGGVLHAPFLFVYLLSSFLLPPLCFFSCLESRLRRKKNTEHADVGARPALSSALCVHLPNLEKRRQP